MVKKKRKQKLKNFLGVYKPIVDSHKNDLPIFDNNRKYKKHQIDTNSWFNLNQTKNKHPTKCNVTSFDELNKVQHKCLKVKMILTDIHKQIFQNWFKASTYTYNKTLQYIRNNFELTKKQITKPILNGKMDKKLFLDKFYIRTQMKNDRITIQKLFSFTINKTKTITNKNIKCEIDAHTLDKTIFQLIQNIKSATTNLLNNNIKRFRLKFWKYTRPKQVIELEKGKISKIDNKDINSKSILCKSIFKHLPEIKYIYNSKEYDISNINHDFKISYNSILDEYLLLVPTNVIITNNVNRKDLVVLDPGLRTFMTGLGDNVMLKIGNNVNSTIRKLIKKKNIIKSNINIPNKIKNKYERRINKRIYNLTNDLHWKTIKYLTDNFKTIFLGDMSAKSIVSKESSKLNDLMKVACLQTRFYDFRLRLKYKCYVTNTRFKLVDEFYTSKTCSYCGLYNNNLGKEKIFNCTNCNKSIDRDINGCRNIYMKQYM
jgi:transposase